MSIVDKFKNGSAAVPNCRAIDIGTTGIRIAALKKNGKKPRLTDLRDCRIPREKAGSVSPEVVLESLRSLTRGMRMKEEVLVSSLPIHRVFVRSLELPFTKDSQIRQVIASEAELHVPFPLDQIIIDYWPVEELAGENTRVIMMAAKKAVLEGHLSLLAEAGIDPSKVSVDLLGSCRAYTSLIDLPAGEATMLLDIGAIHTGAAFLLDGTVVYLRSFSWGGDMVTRAIMEEKGCGFAEAEALKISSAGSGAPIEEVISGVIFRLETELLRTINTAASALGGHPLKNIILTGGASLQHGLKDELSRKLNLEPLDLNPFSGVNTKKSPENPTIVGAALGLAVSEIVPEKVRIDFRRGEFAFGGTWKKLRRRVFTTIALAVGLTAVLALGLFWRIEMEKKTSEALARQIRLIVRRTFPDQPVPVPGTELKAMKDGVEQARNELEYYQDMISVSSLDILREISAVIPEDIKVQVVVLDIDEKRVIFRGRTEKYRPADLIKNALAKSDYFIGDKIKETRDTKTLKKGGKLVTVEFEYNIPIASAAQK